ncbi:MAG: phosphodiesterase [Rhodobacteraceae bacterium]|nr:phosphodiesterase [Paracoccaceae bacterium]
MPLHPAFLTRPLAHRGLHDRRNGIIENSVSAFRAAIAAGYGIELDIQMSADRRAMVFHDEWLDRLTHQTGPVNAHRAATLRAMPLKDSADAIPTLAEVLELVAGRVPLLIEIKDQDCTLGPHTGALEADTARLLAGYAGPVAVMSFNPHAIGVMRAIAPSIAAGLVTDPFDPAEWPDVPTERLQALAAMPDLARLRADFISHNRADLHSPVVAGVKANGLAVLCWTVRSPEQEAEARRVADNITFEGYLP